MVWETFQGPLFFILFILSGITAILGVLLVNHFFAEKNRHLNNTVLFIFTFLAFGYSCFALAEMSWFLIFDVFEQLPSVSMPDFYWVIGSICLLIAFATFSFHMHKQHGSWSQILAQALFAVIVFGIVLIFLVNMNIGNAGESTGEIFLGYFYPIASSLILIFSGSVYFFLEKLDQYKETFFLFLIANGSFLLSDLLYVYYTANNTYGFLGFLSDSLSIVAYLLCALSFFFLLQHTRKASAAENELR